MLEKDQKKIIEELTKLTKEKLLNEFKDSRLRPVDSVENVDILNMEYDNENQDRNKIIVKEFIANIRVHILIDEGSTSSLNTQVKNNKPIEFLVNYEEDTVELSDSDVTILEQKLF